MKAVNFSGRRKFFGMNARTRVRFINGCVPLSVRRQPRQTPLNENNESRSTDVLRLSALYCLERIKPRLVVREGLLHADREGLITEDIGKLQRNCRLSFTPTVLIEIRMR